MVCGVILFLPQNTYSIFYPSINLRQKLHHKIA